MTKWQQSSQSGFSKSKALYECNTIYVYASVPTERPFPLQQKSRQSNQIPKFESNFHPFCFSSQTKIYCGFRHFVHFHSKTCGVTLVAIPCHLCALLKPSPPKQQQQQQQEQQQQQHPRMIYSQLGSTHPPRMQSTPRGFTVNLCDWHPG